MASVHSDSGDLESCKDMQGTEKSPPGDVESRKENCSAGDLFTNIVVIVSAIVIIVIGVVIAIIPSVVLLPFLLAALFVVRILRVFRKSVEYYRILELSFRIRMWIFADMTVVVLGLCIFLVMSNYIPSLKNGVSLGLPRMKWFRIISIIYGLYTLALLLNHVIRDIIPPLPLEYAECGTAFREAVREIIDCMLFWWATYEVLRCLPPTVRHHIVLELQIKTWIYVLLLLIVCDNLISALTHMIVWILSKICETRNQRDTKKMNTLLKGCHWLEKHLHRESLVYWANGLKQSVNFVLKVVMLLLVWVLYFTPRLSKSSDGKWVVEIGTKTLASLLVCSFLWLIKTCLLLSWEAGSVYTRFREKIHQKCKNAYFLGIVGYKNGVLLRLGFEIKTLRDMFHIQHLKRWLINAAKEKDMTEEEFKDWLINEERLRQKLEYLKEDASDNTQECVSKDWLIEAANRKHMTEEEFMTSLMMEEYKREIKSEYLNKQLGDGKQFLKNKKKIKALVTETNLTIFELQQVAHCLMLAKDTLLLETPIDLLKAWRDSDIDKAAPEDEFIHHFWEHADPNHTIYHKSSGNQDEKNTTSHEISIVSDTKQADPSRTIDRNSSGTQDEENTTSQETSTVSDKLTRLLPAMEKNRDSCISLVNMLCSAHDTVKSLNNIISGIIVVAIIILWLLLTGLATTKLLIISTSPLLAATFIFGETLKNLFQGMIFVYVVKPLIIGDLCSVDNQLMEVKSVEIWKTTFTKIEKLGILEEIIYPNTELAKKTIINYKTEFDWDEYMELDVTSTQAEQLSKDIGKYLSEEKGPYIPDSHSVTILVTGEKTKIVVLFKYVKPADGVGTYFGCLQKKDELRRAFSLHVLKAKANCQKKKSKKKKKEEEEE